MNDQELTDDDRFLIAEARRIGPALRARISDQERLGGEVIVRLADLAERLAAALEAALGFHGEHRGHCDGCSDAYGEPVEWPCDEFRAITAALTPAAATEGNHG